MYPLLTYLYAVISGWILEAQKVHEKSEIRSCQCKFTLQLSNEISDYLNQKRCENFV